jgi:O-antigen/teichoic acid export membrane protein
MGMAVTIAKNSVFSIIASMSEMLVGFVTSIVLARSLGTEQYGIYAYLLWFLGLLTIVINLGL